MKRVIAIFAFSGLSLLAGAGAEVRVAPKPNILFIAIDDLKPLLGSYGADWIKSPAMDRLAARGTVFLANYCQAPLCAPTRASLLTGLRPDSTGIYFNPSKMNGKNILRVHLPDVVTLPQYFKKNGYATVAMGKVFDSRTVDEGHDAVSWSRPFVREHKFAHGDPGVRGYQNPETKRRLSEATRNRPDKGEPGPPTEGEDVSDDAYFDGAMALTAVREIENLAKQSQPFFLAVGFNKPHLPFIAPKKYWDLYDRNSLPLAAFQQWPAGSPEIAQIIARGEARSYEGVPKRGQKGGFSEDLQRQLLHGYAACASYVDAQLDLLLRTLEQAGVADNTIICLWGDHGYHLGEHGHWAKSTTFEDATRAPLIIYAPGVGKGVRTTSLTEFLDVYPTLCELAGLPLPGHLQGKSLVPLMRNPSARLHESVFSQESTIDSQIGLQLIDGLLDEEGTRGGINSPMGWALRTPRYRYVEWRDAVVTGKEHVFGSKPIAIELYDYDKDPLERENLAGKVEYQKVLQEQQELFDRKLSYLPKRSPE
jgi:arylsulfatase A-like enzyme